MAGAYWSRGAKFVGEQLAGVFVDTVQVKLSHPLYIYVENSSRDRLD
jgi:hypothetical protein